MKRKGFITNLNPLVMSRSHLRSQGGRVRASAYALRHLVAHVKGNNLKDDVVCKLTVPDSTAANGDMYEIELAVSDVIIMLGMRGLQNELTYAITELRDRVGRNDIDQDDMRRDLQALQLLVDRAFSPERTVSPIVAVLDKESGLPK